MKLAFRLGLVLIPFAFFLSQTAYSADLSDLPAHHLASRGLASVSSVPHVAHEKLARVGEFSTLGDLTARSQASNPSYFQLVNKNAIPAIPIEGSGIGAQLAVVHFGE